jgi:signal transduction histidine kinase
MSTDSPGVVRRNGDAHVQPRGRPQDYIALVAHELREPLLPIVNAASVIARSPDQLDLVRRSAAIIERQARIIGQLIENLMTASGMETGRLRPTRVVVAQLVRQSLEIVGPVAAQRGMRLTVSTPRETVELFGDVLQLGQALQNVLSNAVKFSNPDGEIRLRADRAGDEICITVSDDGVGIAAADIASIFQLFKPGDPRRHSAGLGMGLYLARQMIEAHGGSITATSPGAGLGSTFTIRVPCSPADASPAQDGMRNRSDSAFTTP